MPNTVAVLSSARQARLADEREKMSDQ